MRSIRHRGLRRLIENNDARSLRPDLVNRIRKVLTVLVLADDLESFLNDAPRGWRVHRLSGDRQNEWSVAVSGNWRITYEEEDSASIRLNLEDHR